MRYLIEKENDIFHIDVRAKDFAEQIVKDIKDKNYTHKRKFSFYYMHKNDYFYLNCGKVLDISYVGETLRSLLEKNLDQFKFKFDLNPWAD